MFYWFFSQVRWWLILILNLIQPLQCPSWHDGHLFSWSHAASILVMDWVDISEALAPASCVRSPSMPPLSLSMKGLWEPLALKRYINIYSIATLTLSSYTPEQTRWKEVSRLTVTFLKVFATNDWTRPTYQATFTSILFRLHWWHLNAISFWGMIYQIYHLV